MGSATVHPVTKNIIQNSLQKLPPRSGEMSATIPSPAPLPGRESFCHAHPGGSLRSPPAILSHPSGVRVLNSPSKNCAEFPARATAASPRGGGTLNSGFCLLVGVLQDLLFESLQSQFSGLVIGNNGLLNRNDLTLRSKSSAWGKHIPHVGREHHVDVLVRLHECE